MKLRNVGVFSLAASLMIGVPALAADRTPPTKPVVTDDGDYTTSSTNLHAKWTSSDPESGISKYRYHIREGSISGRKIVDWTSAGLASEITLSGLSLRNGKTYFIGVRAINGNGKESEVGYSDGITIQTDIIEPSPNEPAPASSIVLEGFGADTPGGTGQPIYRVTNLNDSGPGSLRDAVSQGNRYIVFDVAGDILLNSSVPIRGAFVTIDGFTAPSPGITLQNYGIGVDGARGNHDIIIRGIRVRRAGNTVDTKTTDGMYVVHGAYNVVIDHVSIYGSEDGNLDIGTGARDVTVSWSIFIKPAGMEKNMLIKYDPGRITLHHNIFADARQRNPQVSMDNAGTTATDTTLDMRNNIVWNWAGGYGTLVWYGPRVNIVNNFYSNPSGSDGDAIRVCQGECDSNPASAARAYVSGNFSGEGLNLNTDVTETIPFAAPTVNTSDACTAARQVLSDAGLPVRDSIEQQYLGSITLFGCPGA